MDLRCGSPLAYHVTNTYIKKRLGESSHTMLKTLAAAGILSWIEFFLGFIFLHVMLHSSSFPAMARSQLGWIWSSIHGDSDEGNGYNYDVDNFISLTTRKNRFLDADVEAGMMLLSWNNFLRPLLHFAVVRSSYDETLLRIFFCHSS